jgi:hypothetical protein
MSIGVVVPLEDGVILIADSRQVCLARDGRPVEGDQVENEARQKIYFLDERVALITFGVVEVTSETLNVLRQVWQLSGPPLPLETIVSMLDLSLARVWGALNFDPRLDLSGPEYVAGFAVGGIAAEGIFVGLVLRSRQASVSCLSSTDPRARIVIASDAPRAQQIYMQSERSEPAITNFGSASLAEIKQAILRAATRAVREVGSYDQSVGGQVRYAIISTQAPNVSEGTCEAYG